MSQPQRALWARGFGACIKVFGAGITYWWSAGRSGIYSQSNPYIYICIYSHLIPYKPPVRLEIKKDKGKQYKLNPERTLKDCPETITEAATF